MSEVGSDITGPSRNIGLALVILLVVIISLPLIGSFFSEDDFAGLFVDADNLAEFKGFFKAESTGERPWYRPISFQLRFWLMRETFGINPVPFRLLTLILHSVNILLCFSLLQRLTGRNDIPLAGAMLYGLNGAHQMSLYWFSAGNEMVTALFLLCGMHAFLSWRERGGPGRMILTCLTFLLLLMSKETGVMFPLLVLLTDIIFPRNGKRAWGMHITLFIILAIYLLFWFLWQYHPHTGEETGYGLNMNPAALTTNFLTFLGQAFIGSSIIYSIAQSLGGDFGPTGYQEFFTPAVITILVLVFIAIFALSAKFFSNSWQFMPDPYRKLVKWGAAGFVLGLLPVLPLTGHNYAYYMNIALIGLATALASLWFGFGLSAKNQGMWKTLGYVLTGLYILNFGINIHLAQKVRTIPVHSKVALKAYEEIREMDIPFEEGTVLIILDVDKDWSSAIKAGFMFRAMYDELGYCYVLPKGSVVRMKQLEKRGWNDGGPRVFLTYDGEEYSYTDLDYFMGNYVADPDADPDST